MALFVASGIIAALSFWFDNSMKGEQARTAMHICEDMDAIARPYRHRKRERVSC